MENTENKGIALASNLAQMNHVAFANDLITNIKEGNVDPLLVHIFLKRIEKIQEILKDNKEVKEIIINEGVKHALEGKPFTYTGAKISVAAVYTTYDFSSCNDPLWNCLNEEFVKLSEMKKEREAFLKAAFPEKVNKFGFTAPRVIIDKLYYLEQADCGEEVVLNAPIKRQQTGLKVTFPK